MNTSVNRPDPQLGKMSSADTYEDLLEFNATKKTVTDLLQLKRTLLETGVEDVEKIREIKNRAIAAINHLFDDIVSSKKS